MVIVVASVRQMMCRISSDGERWALTILECATHKLDEDFYSCPPTTSVTAMVQIHPHVAANFKACLKSTCAGRQRYDRGEAADFSDAVTRLRRRRA